MSSKSWLNHTLTALMRVHWSHCEDIETEHSHNFYSLKFNTSVYLLFIAFFDFCVMKALIAHI